MFQFDLSGKKAIVTGAAGGIGLAIARRFIAEGACVSAVDLDADRLRRVVADGLSESTCQLVGDVSLETAAETLIERAAKAMGGVDVLVNNAGVAEAAGATVDQTLDDWQRVIDVNLRGAYLMSRAFGRHVLGRSGRGSMVNISSIAGLVGFPASNAYGVSKAGVVHMTKTMAVEWARRGIRVNCVAPGVIDTTMAQSVFDQTEGRERFVRRIPMRRLGSPDEIALVVAFLASEAASYMTGVTIPVDGGWVAFGAG